jgi:hypothetical protein
MTKKMRTALCRVAADRFKRVSDRTLNVYEAIIICDEILDAEDGVRW